MVLQSPVINASSHRSPFTLNDSTHCYAYKGENLDFELFEWGITAELHHESKNLPSIKPKALNRNGRRVKGFADRLIRLYNIREP